MCVTLEAVLLELTPRVLRFCVGYTGDRSLGEDVAQESLAALVRAWRTSGPPDSPDAFVFVVAKRKARRAMLQRRLLLPIDVLFGHRQGGHDPESATIENDKRARMLAAIRRLPRGEREAVLVVIGDGRTLQEAAHTLGISLSAMKMRYSRGRQRLLMLLNNNHDR
jgi:RNA polymerase sigma factor (sigma-70 family)